MTLKWKVMFFLVTHSSSMASTLASLPIPSVSCLLYSWRYKSSDWCNTFENCFFQRTVITPMIEVFGGKAAYSNFWGGMDEDVSHKEREAHAYVCICFFFAVFFLMFKLVFPEEMRFYDCACWIYLLSLSLSNENFIQATVNHH